MVVREAEATMMKPTVTETAAVEYGTAVEATAMEAASVHAAAMPAATATETAAMETSAVEAAAHVTATAHVTAATMTPATVSASTADFGHKTASDDFRRGCESRTNRRHRCRALTWRSDEQHHRCRSKAEAADKASPWIGDTPHA